MKFRKFGTILGPGWAPIGNDAEDLGVEGLGGDLGNEVAELVVVEVVGPLRTPSQKSREGRRTPTNEMNTENPQPTPTENQHSPVQLLGDGLRPNLCRPFLGEEGGSMEHLFRDG